MSNIKYIYINYYYIDNLGERTLIDAAFDIQNDLSNHNCGKRKHAIKITVSEDQIIFNNDGLTISESYSYNNTDAVMLGRVRSFVDEVTALIIPRSESVQNREAETRAFEYNAVNVSDSLNIIDSPSVNGNVIRPSFFGEYFYIIGRAGGGNIENGILDLWYRISYENEERGAWVNALYVREFPFYIASDIISYEVDGFYSREAMLQIKKRRTINNTVELQASGGRWEWGDTGAKREYSSTPIELQESYLVNNLHTPLINSKFNNLSVYAGEINKLSDDTVTRTNERIDDRENSNTGNNIYTTIDSENVRLTGVRVGSHIDDIFVFFGDDYELQTDNVLTHIIYHGSFDYNAVYNKLTFVIGEDERVKEIIYAEGWRK
jgi:hypothetical protein